MAAAAPPKSYPPYVDLAKETLEVPLYWKNDPEYLGFENDFYATKDYPDTILTRLAAAYGYAAVLPVLFSPTQETYVLRGQDATGRPQKLFVYEVMDSRISEITNGRVTGNSPTETAINTIIDYDLSGLTLAESKPLPKLPPRDDKRPSGDRPGPPEGG